MLQSLDNMAIVEFVAKTLGNFFDAINSVIWSWPERPMPLLAMVLIGVGLFLTIRLRLINIRGFWHAIKIVKGDYDDPDDPGDISHFQALSTALSATVGVGNIGGVAIAIHYGGPGTLFWMWVTAFLGMSTKFTECTLALHYRIKNHDGTVSGGPMYYIRDGLKLSWLAWIFAFCASISAFGSGNAVQANTMADSLLAAFSVPTWITGIIASVIVGLVIIGGIKRIGSFTSKIVPLMALLYMIGALTILIFNAKQIPAALLSIFSEAFRPSAAIGGFAGATFLYSLTWGVKRGLFSNEAGQGSAPIAHAAARTDIAVREGSVALLEPFIDTLTICTITGLVVLTTGVWKDKLDTTLPFTQQSNIQVVKPACTIGENSQLAKNCAYPKSQLLEIREGIPLDAKFVINHALVEELHIVDTDGRTFSGKLEFKENHYYPLGQTENNLFVKGKMLLNGSPLTARAFEVGLAHIFPFGAELIAICVLLFALSTAIGWSYYGERSIQYLFSDRAILPYKLIFVLMQFVGSVIKLEAVWSFGDAALGMMALPNLFALVFLSKQVARLTKDYQTDINQ